MNHLNLVLYSSLQFEYNQEFRRKYRIQFQHLQILQLLYYFELKPPKGAVKQAIRVLLSLHAPVYLDKLYVELYDRAMITYQKKSGVYSIGLLPHIREELSVLYDESNITSFIEGKIKGFSSYPGS